MITEVSNGHFSQIAEKARADQRNSAVFDLATGPGVAAKLGIYSRRSEVVGIHLTSLDPGFLSIWGDHVAPLEPSDPTQGYVYPASNQRAVREYKDELRSVSFPPVAFESAITPEERRKPQVITSTEAAALIGTVDPRQIVFYTGAGISKAGKFPILDHVGLAEQMGYTLDDSDPNAFDANRDFIHQVLTNPAKCKDIMHVLSEFRVSMSEDASTPAHCAIASIARYLGCMPSVVTTNYDLKHEAEGSRLIAGRAFLGWHADHSFGLPEYLERQRLDSRRTIMALGGGATRLLVVAGVSNDYRGTFGFLRSQRPDLSMLAVNSAQPGTLPYLSEGDFQVVGDAQMVLPTIKDILA